MWIAIIAVTAILHGYAMARIDQFELKSGRMGRDEDGNLVAVELNARRMVGHDRPFSSEMAALCATAAYIHPDECRHCLSTLFEQSLIQESRTHSDRPTDSRPYKDRSVRLLSRLYRVLGEDRSMKQVCVVGHFEEQLLRFLAVYLQQHPDLVVSWHLLQYGSSDDAETGNVAVVQRIVDSVLWDFQLTSGRIRYHMATDIAHLDLSALRHCDILHIQDIQRQNADLAYAYTPTKTSGSPNDGRHRMVSLSDVYSILRVRLAELQRQQQTQQQSQRQQVSITAPTPTMIIYATDDAASFDRVTIPPMDSMPADLQASLSWFGSAVAFDGAVDYGVPDILEEEDVPQRITASCGRLISVIGDVFFQEAPTTMYVGRLVPPPVSVPHEPSPSPSPAPPAPSFEAFRHQTSIYITFAFPLFLETAHGLRKALTHELGFPAAQVHVVGYLSWTELVAAAAAASSAPSLQICIGAHQGETWLLPSYLVFHTENHWNTYLAQSTIYTRVLQAAQGVMAYSPAHLAFLRRVRASTTTTTDPTTNDRRRWDAVVVPFFTEPLYYAASVVTWGDDGKEHVAIQPRFCADTALLPSGIVPLLPCHHQRRTVMEPVVDVIMLGARSIRRREFLQQVVVRYFYEVEPVTNVVLAMRNLSERPSMLVNFVVQYIDLHTRQRQGLAPVEQLAVVFDPAEIYVRETLSLLSRVTMNVHQNEHAVFETHRVNSLLALGVAVVSERTTYTERDASEGDSAVLPADPSACRGHGNDNGNSTGTDTTEEWRLEDPYEAAGAVQLATQWSDLIESAATLASPSQRETLRLQQLRAFHFYNERVARNATALQTLLYHLYEEWTGTSTLARRGVSHGIVSSVRS